MIDLSRDRLPRALRDQRQRVLSGLVDSQRTALLLALATAMRLRLDLSAQARAVRDSLGLSQVQVQALARYRGLLAAGGARAALASDRPVTDELSRELRDALDASDDVPADLEDRLGASYRVALVAAGATLLGDLLGQQALAAGTEAAFGQALDDGFLVPDTLEDRWWTRRDERVRSSHRAMHGQIRPHGEPFRSGAGNSLAYPGDPSAPLSDTVRCRCFVTTSARAGALVG